MSKYRVLLPPLAGLLVNHINLIFDHSKSIKWNSITQGRKKVKVFTFILLAIAIYDGLEKNTRGLFEKRPLDPQKRLLLFVYFINNTV